ncbi:adenine methyltransferase [Pseudoalteromonas lipolytica]|uniref:site-specific DNA-methyltransferase (adenine-specific) n=1 Tax=Pseudoalteromonas lipolytica TaxID=570156 RepID=A0AAD0RXH3_9GAMM|nr:N-6 DNA methylase [Pseudoalteromonas donghaensis]AXV64187.1 adenine methyltransferase [Pseudoalteromonas donghaensis]
MDIQALVEKYERDRVYYCSNKYNETQLRTDFLDPLFELLGWDISNSEGKPTNEREVLVEEGLKATKSSNTKKPDYTFRQFSQRKFFVEAKKPSVDVNIDSEPAKQVRRYGFTAKLKVSVLSNFEYLAIYDCSAQVEEDDLVSNSRIKVYHYSEYIDCFDELIKLLGKESVYNGQFDIEWSQIEDKINHFSVDNLFLAQINEWRVNLAATFLGIKTEISDLELNDLTQSYVNSIVFLRVCEDRSLEEFESLLSLSNEKDYAALVKLLHSADKKYNSGLFDLPYIDELISDKNSYIWEIIEQLYFPQSTYSFSVFSSDILGSIYEIFLAEKIDSTSGEIKLIPKAENVDRDIVTTPTHIIRDILRKTVVKYCENKNDTEILNSKFADIACGSGAFLLELFQVLQDVLVDYYLINDNSKLVQVSSSTYKLNYQTKSQLLTSCIFGVDKDYNAVKAAQFGLLLKLLEDEDNSTITVPVLPTLKANILFGNSLVEPNDVSSQDDLLEINPFEFGEYQFDVIVGNPPYLATEHMKKLTPKELSIYSSKYDSAYKQFDKYFLFIERGLSLLKDNGFFGYIIPSKFMKVGAGKNLREFLSKNNYVSEILSFGANQVFKNKTTYTCILVAQKNMNESFEFTEVNDLSKWNIRDYNSYQSVIVESTALGSDTWVLEPSTQKVLNALAENTLPLIEILGEKTIENGIQTSANSVYIHKVDHDDGTYLHFGYAGNSFQVEKELTRPYFKTGRGDDTLYTYRNLQPNTFVIYPYRKIDDCIELVQYEELESDYPFMFQFLSVIRDKLDNDKRDIKPEPKTENEWYRYGRSQSLENCDVPKKIVVGVLSNGFKYSIDEQRTFISSGGTAGYCPINIPTDCNYSIYYIQALLTSKYLEWFASVYGEVFRGGYVARGTKVLKRMPIVRIDFDDAESKRLHDDIAKLQLSLNSIYEQYEKHLGNPRQQTPLMRSFQNKLNEMNTLLRRLFNLGELDELIPEVSELYSGKDD